MEIKESGLTPNNKYFLDSTASWLHLRDGILFRTRGDMVSLLREYSCCFALPSLLLTLIYLEWIHSA